MTPTDTIIALEKALEAGPTAQEWIVSSAMDIFPFNGNYLVASCGGKSGLYRNSAANAPFIAACNPLAIRTLLDAHASALRDAEKLRGALIRLETAVDWHLGRSGFTQSTQLKGVEHGANVRKELYAAHDDARAALDDNTKGAAE